MQFIKSTWKKQSLTQPKKNAVKSLKNRQMWTKHIIKPTYGDVSTLEGGWEAFTDQMLRDLKFAVQQPSSLNHPSCFTEWCKRKLALIRQVT